MEPDTIIKAITGLGVVTSFTVIFYILSNVEKGFKKEKIKEFGKKLVDVVNKPLLSTFGNYVLELTNRLFTKEHFSFKCFWRSLIASSLFVLLLHFLFFFFHTDVFKNTIVWEWIAFIPSFILSFLLYNSLDFFLLWKTRRVLQLATSKKKYNIFVVGVIDLIVTFTFAVAKVFIIKLIIDHTFQLNWHFFTHYILKVNYPPSQGSTNDPRVIPGLFFYSSFFYSIFLWLYFISIFLIKRMQFLGRFKTWFQDHIDIENKPIEFLKIMFGILILFIGVGVWAFTKIL
jgi:hypothetical protein